MKRIAIIGSHGLYANYGGWDQLVNNLAEKKSKKVEYLIFNSVESPEEMLCPPGVTVRRLKLKAAGFQGLFYDFWSILLCYGKIDGFLLLGIQGIPLLALFSLFKKKRIISNVGGIEWERPKFNFMAKSYLKLCFRLAFQISDYIILDNPHYQKFIPKRPKSKVKIIPYGGEIDYSLEINDGLQQKYNFINKDFFLSISRSLKDNLIDELCESFTNSKHNLVLISNFSKSEYGKNVYGKYKDHKNITLINGLYVKSELDLIRRKCKAYIHTHTLCGTAPSLVEMIVAQRPIFSIDIPQNRFTLHDEAFFYKDFLEIQALLNNKNDLTGFVPSLEISTLYKWDKVVEEYESMY